MNQLDYTLHMGEERFELASFHSDSHDTIDHTSNTNDGHHSSYDTLVSAHSRSSSPSSLQYERRKQPAFTRVHFLLARPFRAAERWKKQSRFHGWQWGVLVGACIGTFVLLMNCAFVLVGATTRSGYQDGIATLFIGSATSISRASTLLHILINILSTLLLSASNYAMQVLSAPTQDECENAHQRGQWLDIGILSMRNIGGIATRRRILWFALGLSSIPLHLFYNASVFQVITGNAYQFDVIKYGSPEWVNLSNTKGISNLTISELKAAYDQEFVSEYGDVSLVVGNVSLEYDIAYFHDRQNQSVTFPVLEMPLDTPTEISGSLTSDSWIIGIDDNGRTSAESLHNKLISAADSMGATVLLNLKSGLAHAGARNSKVQLSLPFLLIVVVCNAIKVGCLVSMLVQDLGDAGSPMVTIGDAVASFLERPDKFTRGYCTYSKAEYFWKSGRIKRTPLREEDGRAAKMDRRCRGVWERKTNNYGSAISKRKRVLLTFIGFGLPLALLIPFMMGMIPLTAWGTASPLRLSFGQQKFDGNATSQLAFIANSPQLLLSVIYLYFNNMFTSMALAYEWNQFGTHRKGLRVTKPTGEQRETYFLQLPLKWGVPLNALSGLLHWLTSQTLFVVRLDRMTRDGDLKTDSSEAACGFSSSALLALLLVLLALFIIVTVLGFISFEAHVPFAGSCSWVISAACHPDPDEVNPALGKVKWGVIAEVNGSEDGVGNCSFSRGSVKKPKVGKRYE